MPWVTDSRRPALGVHQIPDCDFDPRRHTRAKPPKGREKEAAPVAGTGAPEISIQEHEEAAAQAEAAPKPKRKAKGKKPAVAPADPESTDAEAPATAE
jgi:hypothetical protein